MQDFIFVVVEVSVTVFTSLDSMNLTLRQSQDVQFKLIFHYMKVTLIKRSVWKIEDNKFSFLLTLWPLAEVTVIWKWCKMVEVNSMAGMK